MSDTPELDEVVAVLDQVMPLLQSLTNWTYEMAYAQGITGQLRYPHGLHTNDLARIQHLRRAAALGLGRWPSSKEQFVRPPA
jgi:hypothetical protein